MDKSADQGLAQLDAMPEPTSDPGSLNIGAVNADEPPATESKVEGPQPLPESLLPVEAFDMALLPDVLQPWAKDICNRVQCPPDFVGVTIMVALATVIGRRIGVRPKCQDDWTEYANQWACIVGRPGTMKSPAMAAALAPLNALEAKASKKYADDLAVFGCEAQIHAMRLDAQKKSVAKTLAKDAGAEVSLAVMQERPPPTLKRYKVNDATPESLLDICIENPQGVCAYRDELVSMLKSLEREGQESARGFYLTGWNGNSGYTADRIGRGRNMRAEAVCLSLLGSTQPGRIAEYLRAATSGGASDDGLIQRFGFLVWPDVSGDWCNVDKWPDSAAKTAAFAVFKKLDADDPVNDWRGEVVKSEDGTAVESEPPFLRFNNDAAETFLEWRKGFEIELRSGNLHPAMESHLSKYRKLVPGIALICHLADGGTGSITGDAMFRALAWANYLKSHAERAYGSVTVADMAGAKALLKRIAKEEVETGFTARDIYRKQWTLLSTRADASSAIEILVDYGWLESVTQTTEGRSKTTFKVIPKAAP